MKKRTNAVFRGAMAFSFLMGMVMLSPVKDTYGAVGVEEADLIQEGVIDEDKYDIQYGMDSIALYNAGAQEVADAREAIYNAIVACEPTVSIQQYKLTLDEARAAFNYVINTNPDLFYVNNTFRYSYSYSDPYIISLTFTYEYAGEALEERLAAFYEEADKILAGVKESWSDLEKAIYVHDYFCSHYQYDTTYTRYDAADLFVDKQAVCNGYYLAYRYILDQLGIECDAAESSSMNHIWNQIKINGKWYHVDVTWDDPLDDIIGRTNHKDFLKSDTAFTSQYGHYDWVSNNTCTDTSYDGAFWNDVTAPFAYANGTWYCVNDKDLYTCDVNQVKLGTKLFSVGTWYVSGSTSYWTKAYTGLGYYDGILYYNTPSAIKGYNPKTGVTATVMNGTSTLYGCYLDKNIIHYGYASSPNEKVSESGTYTLPLSEEDKVVRSTQVTLDQAAISLYVGDKKMLTATVLPANATNRKVIFSSADESIATVDQSGNVTAQKKGTTRITATTQDTGKTAVCEVTVQVHTGWEVTEEGSRYRDEEGEYVVAQSLEINGIRYWFDEEGYLRTGWYEENGHWYFLDESGVMIKDCWIEIDGKEYRLDADGVMQSGWYQEEGIWYYLNGGAKVADAWKKIGGRWYHFNADGAMQTGWYGEKKDNLSEETTWYYFKSDGAMVSDAWWKIGGKWYHFNAGGIMQTGWYKEGAIWYYFKGDGTMQTGWLKVGTTWYYFKGDGAMVSNAWYKIGGKWYHFNAGGAMQTGWYGEKKDSLSEETTWYYFNGDGAMVSNTWWKISGVWYYFKSDGAMAASEWVDDGSYYVDENGKLVE